MVTQAIHDDHEPVGQSKPRKGKSKGRARAQARVEQGQRKDRASLEHGNNSLNFDCNTLRNQKLRSSFVA